MPASSTRMATARRPATASRSGEGDQFPRHRLYRPQGALAQLDADRQHGPHPADPMPNMPAAGGLENSWARGRCIFTRRGHDVRTMAPSTMPAWAGHRAGCIRLFNQTPSTCSRRRRSAPGQGATEAVPGIEDPSTTPMAGSSADTPENRAVRAEEEAAGKKEEAARIAAEKAEESACGSAPARHSEEDCPLPAEAIRGSSASGPGPKPSCEGACAFAMRRRFIDRPGPSVPASAPDPAPRQAWLTGARVARSPVNRSHGRCEAVPHLFPPNPAGMVRSL